MELSLTGERQQISSRSPPAFLYLNCSDYTKGNFILRAQKPNELERLKSDVRNCFEGAATSTKCKIKVTVESEYKGSRILKKPNRRLGSECSFGRTVRVLCPTIRYRVSFPSGARRFSACFDRPGRCQL